MQKFLIISAFILGATAVAAGAMGSHALSKKLTPDYLQVYETAVRYMFYHVFAIVIAVFVAGKTGNQLPLYGGISFLAGIILFSGSLFLLSTRAITGLEWSWLGPITPIGGVAFIAGWIMLAVAVFQWK
jgi:uncharacterized membrane protein YgdD (TMEM256/DUF423 family)